MDGIGRRLLVADARRTAITPGEVETAVMKLRES